MKGGRRLLTKIKRSIFSGFSSLWLRPLNQKAKKGIQVIFILTLVTLMSFSSPGPAAYQSENNGTRLNGSFIPCSGEDGGRPALSANPDNGLAQLDPYFAEPPSELYKFLERYDVDRAALLRYYNIPNFPVTYFISYNIPISQACINRLKKFYTEWKSNLARINFEALRPDSRVEYLLFKNLLDREFLRLERSEQRVKEMKPLIPFAQKIIDLAESKRRMEPTIPEKAAAVLNELLREIEETMRKIKTGDLAVKKTLARRAEEALPSLRDSLSSWFRFSYAYDPLFTWWTKEPYRKVEDALQEYLAFLREEVIGRKTGDSEEIIADAIGRDALLDELAHEMIPYTPEELIEIGKKELEWCEKELKKAARELGFGDDWKKALEHVKTHHVEPGKQPELVRTLALEAIEFVEKRNLITVPELAKEVWRMEMTPPERQPINPFITGGEVIRMSFPTYDMTHEEKLMIMRSNNIHTSRAIVHHELIPGHHLQRFMNRRHRAYRSGLFRTDFWREGWALYWEILLLDLGFPRSPEDRIGMLFWRIHRCARIIFALSFHLGKMTPQEAIDFIVKRVGHERFSAIGEVRRPLERDRPLQPLSYMIGALQYMAMRRELVESGRMTDRQFHDSILQNNYMPVAMLRALLTGQKLREDFSPSWRFYELSSQR
jgi:hypothetical protein